MKKLAVHVVTELIVQTRPEKDKQRKLVYRMDKLIILTLFSAYDFPVVFDNVSALYVSSKTSLRLLRLI